MKFESTFTVGNLIESLIFLGVVFKAYGDWRIQRNRINTLWKDYLVRHKLEEGDGE